MRIIIGVDLVLGPLLTLIVFRAGKPGLRADLTMIGVFQAICLTAGVYIVHSERPVALVWVDGQFNSMTVDSYRNSGIDVPDWRAFPGAFPKQIQVSLPSDVHAHADLRREMMVSEKQMNLATEYYAPFAPDAAEFAREAHSYDDLEDRDQERQDIPRFLAEHGGSLEDYYFYPLAARYHYYFLGFRKSDLRLAGLLKTPGPT